MITEIEDDSAWKQVARRYFFKEHDDPKTFFELFSEPASVYMELARRVTKAAVKIEILPSSVRTNFVSSIYANVVNAQDQAIEAGAYRTMYEAFKKDVETNNTVELGHLVELYEEFYVRGQ